MSKSKIFQEEDVKKWALNRIPPKRHPHVQGVVESATQLAQLYVPDQVHLARLAGWLHDAAKHLPDDELLRIAEAHNYPITPTERLVPMLLHGAVGYFIANDEFGFNDQNLLMACAYHTTGHPEMNRLAQVVMLADLIEPTRNFEGVERLRQLAMQDLSEALLLSLDLTIQYIIQKRQILDERAILLRNKLLIDNRA
ncbi:MAG: phosphohydrolase [Phototrophicales bacterium]|nr:MAG: phosphohydrolase [Phototrophicales bacterium]